MRKLIANPVSLIKFTGIVAFSLGTLFTQARNLNNGGEEAEKTVKEHVKFPKLILPVQQNEKVEVVFTTGDNGKVNFVLAKTEDALLKKEIEKQFTNLVLPQLKKDVAYSVVLRFKTV